MATASHRHNHPTPTPPTSDTPHRDTTNRHTANRTTNALSLHPTLCGRFVYVVDEEFSYNEELGMRSEEWLHPTECGRFGYVVDGEFSC